MRSLAREEEDGGWRVDFFSDTSHRTTGEASCNRAHNGIHDNVINDDAVLAKLLLELDDQLSQAEGVEAEVHQISVLIHLVITADYLTAALPHDGAVHMIRCHLFIWAREQSK